jgi:hypothetical protein
LLTTSGKKRAPINVRSSGTSFSFQRPSGAATSIVIFTPKTHLRVTSNIAPILPIFIYVYVHLLAGFGREKALSIGPSQRFPIQ